MLHFEVTSKLDKKIRVTELYWEFIINIKHPSMKGKEDVIKKTLKDPDQIRKSKTDTNVYLYYKKNAVFTCVICRHENGEGFIITTYQTDKIKEGVIIWKK